MVDRGQCTFVTKAKNIEKMGGIMAIIVDNIEERSNLILMVDDGRGHNLHTPAYFISKKDGDLIKFSLSNSDDGVMVKASLDITNKDNTVVYELFYASPFDFIDWDIKGF
jgi:hypothetical protein